MLKVLADVDQDGLPDAWEKSFGYTTNNASDGLLDGDGDGDGSTARDEYEAGTNPTNAQSRLAILGISQTSNTTVLAFIANSNRTYTVEQLSSRLDGDWRRLADVLATKTNRLVSIADTSAPPAAVTRFYRLVTPRRP